jgi:hypothetical protein
MSRFVGWIVEPRGFANDIIDIQKELDGACIGELPTTF